MLAKGLSLSSQSVNMLVQLDFICVLVLRTNVYLLAHFYVMTLFYFGFPTTKSTLNIPKYCGSIPKIFGPFTCWLENSVVL
jgi:hypothetical protein